MRVLVVGKYGQVARCIGDLAQDHQAFELIFAARKDADVFLDLNDEASIRSAVQAVKPEIIINAGAYTAVDNAEDEPDLAMQINGVAPGILAEEAEKLGAVLIHISTDYVFDGTLDRPYRPDDETNPIGAYGRSKLAGELAVRAATKNYIIARTAWVYSPYGKNFHKTMVTLGETRDQLRVVDDQIGNPTSAHEIAEGLFHLCHLIDKGQPHLLGSTIHIVGREEMTWCAFARKIFADNKIACEVEPITTADYPTKAARPKNSRLERTVLPTLD